MPDKCFASPEVGEGVRGRQKSRDPTFEVTAFFTSELCNSFPAKFSKFCFKIQSLKLKMKPNIKYIPVSQ